MTYTKHIAIVVCDTPIPEFAPKYGDFGKNITDLLQSTDALDGLGTATYYICGEDSDALEAEYERLESEIQRHNVVGLVLSGGRADSFSEEHWVKRLDTFLNQTAFPSGLPLVGICFGHQIIAKNMGCPVGRNGEIGWECGVTKIDPSAEAKEILGIDDLYLSEFHQDIVHKLPEPQKGSTFANIGSSSRCSLQGILTSSGPFKVLTLQGHPEFESDYMYEMVETNVRHGRIPEKEGKEFAENTKTARNDGRAMGKVIVNFIKEANSGTVTETVA